MQSVPASVPPGPTTPQRHTQLWRVLRWIALSCAVWVPVVAIVPSVLHDEGVQPITGAEQVTSAPELPAGTWIDELGAPGQPGSQLFYTLPRRIPGSSVTVTASIEPQSGDNLTVRLLKAPDECASGRARSGSDYVPVMAATAHLEADADAEPACLDGALTIVVERESEETGGEAVPLRLLVSEEPVVTNRAVMATDMAKPDEPKLPGGPSTPLPGGASFDEPVLLTPGTYSGELRHGETRYFAVQVGWGQYLASGLRIGPLRQQENERAGTESYQVRLMHFSPTRQTGDRSESAVRLDGLQLDQVTAPAGYRNRENSSTEAMSRAGLHYLVISLAPGPGDPISYTLHVGVGGTDTADATSIPAYRSEGFGDDPRPLPSLDGSELARRERLGWVLTGSGVALGLAGLGLGIGLAVRHRRSS